MLSRSPLNSELKTHNSPLRKPLWLAERALALERGAGLLHRRKRPFLIGIFKPPSLPKVTGGMDRGDFGTAVLVKSHSIDGTRDVNPVDHNPDCKKSYGKGEEATGAKSRESFSPSSLHLSKEGVATHPFQ